MTIDDKHIIKDLFTKDEMNWNNKANKWRALIATATHPRTPKHEALTAARLANQYWRKYFTNIDPDDEPASVGVDRPFHHATDASTRRAVQGPWTPVQGLTPQAKREHRPGTGTGTMAQLHLQRANHQGSAGVCQDQPRTVVPHRT
jgi:hypothetical protein